MREAYNFARGQVLARKYEVMQRLRAGRRGELYRLHERVTGIERTAKVFAPVHGRRLAQNYAMKLHRLRHCDILMPYRTHETFSYQGEEVTFLVSDFFDGEPLGAFLARQPSERLNPFEGLHLLHSLAAGVEKVHAAGEHHGDLDLASILVRRVGLGFRVKLVDLDPLHAAKPAIIKQDVADLLSLFARATAWPRALTRQPRPVRAACQTLRTRFDDGKLKHAGDLRRHLECLSWS
jgi:serine/threonine protein kinase